MRFVVLRETELNSPTTKSTNTSERERSEQTEELERERELQNCAKLCIDSTRANSYLNIGYISW